MLPANPLSDLADTGAFARDIEDDRPRLECGVFGVYGMADAKIGVARLDHT